MTRSLALSDSTFNSLLFQFYVRLANSVYNSGELHGDLPSIQGGDVLYSVPSTAGHRLFGRLLYTAIQWSVLDNTGGRGL